MFPVHLPPSSPCACITFSHVHVHACVTAAPRPEYFFTELVQSKVAVTNMRGVYDDELALHIITLLLAINRQICDYRDQQTKQIYKKLRGFDAQLPPNVDVTTATALIVGVGNAGLETARLCKALGMTVLGVDARRAPSELASIPDLAELHAPEALLSLLPRADFVLVTVPHTPSTEGMFDKIVFAAMKNTAVLVNIGRGMVVKIDDLSDALYSGAIGGAGLDVLEIEPLPEGHPLWGAPNCILTPHVAVQGDPKTVKIRRENVFVENVGRFISGGQAALNNVVDKANWF